MLSVRFSCFLLSLVLLSAFADEIRTAIDPSAAPAASATEDDDYYPYSLAYKSQAVKAIKLVPFLPSAGLAALPPVDSSTCWVAVQPEKALSLPGTDPLYVQLSLQL
jgi:hypothetical protein